VVLALAVGYSRVYVGVHYPMDVVAGYVVGAISASIVLGLSLLLPLHRL
jgi:undecaprenyl-diphosphatase